MNKVLIIEDEIRTAEPVQTALKFNGISADIAANGQQGIDMFKKTDYDLVLLDLKMPGMSGEDVLKQIREIDPFVDVIIYTNYSEFADIKKLTNIGIDGYINKGPNAELGELVNTIKEKLSPLSDEIALEILKDVPQTDK